MPKIYSRYNPPLRPGLICSQPTRAQQHFKYETDINRIVQRAIATRDDSIFTPTQRAQFYDCSIYSDYQSALETLADVEDDFSTLPSAVRKQFGNDPDKYVQFMSNPNNLAKAIELGLLEGSGKTQEATPPSAPEQPAVASKPPVSEPSAAAPTPAGHSSS